MYNIPGLPAWSQDVNGNMVNHPAVDAQMGVTYTGDKPQLPQRAKLLYALTPETAGQQTSQLLPLTGANRSDITKPAGGFSDLTQTTPLPPLPK
jgi:hypothetical protein